MILAEREAPPERSKSIDRTSSFRGAFRYGKREKAANALAIELKPIALGEPSAAFFPPRKDLDLATAEDVQKRIAEQNERCIELWHYGDWNAGNLPESWRRYLVRHWEEIQALLSSPESSLPTRKLF